MSGSSQLFMVFHHHHHHHHHHQHHLHHLLRISILHTHMSTFMVQQLKISRSTEYVCIYTAGYIHSRVLCMYSMCFSSMKFFCGMRGKKTRYINKKHKKLVVQHQYAKKTCYSKQEYVQCSLTTILVLYAGVCDRCVCSTRSSMRGKKTWYKN